MKLTKQQANTVYDILVREAGADNRERWREEFVQSQTTCAPKEYRFGGSLGFGGKFWNSADRWYVTAYPEDYTPYLAGVIMITNDELADLKDSYATV